MNRTVALSFAVLLASAFVGTADAQQARSSGGPKMDQKKVFTPPAKGEQGWHAYGKPASLAAMVDSRVAALSNVWFGYLGFSDVPEGRANSQGVGLIVSPSKYHLEFIIYRHRVDAIGQGVAIADGRRAFVKTGAQVSKPVPVGQLNRLVGVDLAKDFPVRFDELIFAGIGNKQRPLSSYVAAASRPGSGYIVSSETRIAKGRSATATQYRILVRRTQSVAKRLGAMSFEVVFDARQKLPVSGRYLATPLKGQPIKLSWGARWTLGGTNYSPTAFTIPAGI